MASCVSFCVQAMCLGVPVLVRGVAGNLAIVDDGHTGLVFNTPQVNDVISALERIPS